MQNFPLQGTHNAAVAEIARIQDLTIILLEHPSLTAREEESKLDSLFLIFIQKLKKTQFFSDDFGIKEEKSMTANFHDFKLFEF